MGRKQHEHLETDALLARKDEQISTLDVRLHETITHLSLVRARLLSTLDQLDALQQGHTAALAAAAREQRRLEAKLRAAEEMGREGEADRMDMRDAVGTLVKRVEATPDFRNWPRPQIHLSSLSEPSILFSSRSPHSSPSKPKSRQKQGPPSLSEEPPLQPNVNHTHAALTEQLAHATTLISHFRSARDEALVRAEHGDATVLELEARLARREAALEACAGCRVCVSAATARTTGAQSPPPLDVGPTHLRVPPPIMNSRDRGPDEIIDVLDVSLERNRELEREITELSHRLDRARSTNDKRSRPTHLRAREAVQGQRERGWERAHGHRRANGRASVPTQAFQAHDDDGGGSLLSSLLFSSSASTSSTATSGAAAGTVTPRQREPRQSSEIPAGTRGAVYDHDHDHEYQYRYGNFDERSFSAYEDEDAAADEDEDESVTQPVDELKQAALPSASIDIHFDYNDNVVSSHPAVLKPATTPVPVSALQALERQIALLGAKIDAFAAERRAVEGLVDSGGLNLYTLRLGVGPQATVDAVEVTRADRDLETRDIGSVSGKGRKDVVVGDVQGRDTRVDQRDERERSDGSGAGASAGEGSAREDLKRPHFRPEDIGYDHPHETCEATLLAARKREMELMARVRVLEGALSLVQARQGVETELEAETEMRERKGSESGDDVLDRCGAGRGGLAAGRAPPAREDEGQARWVDAAVQTPTAPPQSPLITPALVGDLLGFDDPESHVVGEERRKSTERVREGMLGREDEEESTDDGEMPMELATPLLPVRAIPAPDAEDENDWEGPRNGHDDVSYGLASEAVFSVEEDRDAGSEWDPPDPPADDNNSQIPQSANAVLDDEQRQGPADEVELGGNPLPQDHLGSSTACPHPSTPPPTRPSPLCSSTHDSALPSTRPDNPSPPSSTGTSPTIAVGLLPPLPLHAHLSLPLPRLHHSHSHPASSFSSLLPLTNPHSGLHRAYTDSDIGMDSQQTGSAHRFVMYRATSSFVAELRQVESRLAETALDEDQRALGRVADLVAPVVPEAEAETGKERHDSDEHLSPLPPPSESCS